MVEEDAVLFVDWTDNLSSYTKKYSVGVYIAKCISINYLLFDYTSITCISVSFRYYAAMKNKHLYIYYRTNCLLWSCYDSCFQDIKPD